MITHYMHSLPYFAMRQSLLLLALAMALSTAHADTTTGLVGWWKLNEGSGVSAPDSSGNGNHGTITGAVWSERQGRACLSFDGNSLVSVPHSASLTPTSMTLSVWAHIDDNGSRMGLIDKMRSVESPYRGYVMAASAGDLNAVDGLHHVNGSGIEVQIRNGNGIGGSSAIKAMRSRWQHFVYTYSAAGAKSYVNGVLVDSYSTSVSLPANTNFPLFLGASPLLGNLQGALRDARIYNRVLTQADVTELYQANTLSGPRSHYALESNAQDSSGNAQHGTINGAPTYVRGVVGRGLKLNGGADEVNIGPDQRLEEATVAAFVRLDEAASGTAAQNIVTSWESDQNYVLGIQRDAQGQSRVTARFRKRQDITHAWPEQSVVSTTVLTPGIFHHAALTYDGGGTLRLFVNGHEEAASVSNGNAEVTSAAQPADVRVGHVTDGTTALKGTVDEVQIHDRALSAYEMRMLASGAFGQVIYDQDFDDPGGTGGVFSVSDDMRFAVTTGAAQRPPTAYFENKPPEAISTLRVLLPEVPAHSQVTVAFDLYVLGPWTGSASKHRLIFGSGTNTGYKPIMDAPGGVISFDSTFANKLLNWQRFPSLFTTGLNPAGRGAYETNSLGSGQDAVYRIVKTIAHSSPSLFFDIHQPGHSVAGQHWGIDNLVISTSSVAPLVDVFSLAGTVGGTSLPTGSILVQASTARPNSTTDQVAATTGAFTFAALSAPDFYIVRGFVDANANGLRDPYEWVGTANGGAPIYLDSNQTGIAIVIAPPVDSDNDGLSDEWELENVLIVGTKDAALDKDSDGLTNAQEYWLGTSVTVADSDGDGQTDGQEWEIGANPLSLDSDGDGMPDAWEIAHCLDPRRNDATEDRDFDFVTNLTEFTNGTNPDSADSDNDGVSDYEEINGKTNWLAIYDKNNRLVGQRFDNGASLFYGYDANSNPVRQVLSDSPDKDRDGMLDIWELANGLNPALRSDGYADTDGDGMSSYQEYIADTDPASATSSSTNPGEMVGSASLDFTPTTFVMATGQLDGAGAEEIVVSGDGNPGSAINTLRVFTFNGTTWTNEVIPVGNVGVTSIAIGVGPQPPIFVGTRAVAPAQGAVLKFTKSAGVWSQSVFLTSSDEVAFTPGVRLMPGPAGQGMVVVQYSVLNETPQKLYGYDQTTGASMGTIDTDGGVKSNAPSYAKIGGDDFALVRQTPTNPGAEIQCYAVGFGARTTVPLLSTQVLSTPSTFQIAAKLRPGLSSRPSKLQFRVKDTNGSGVLDAGDEMILTESDPRVTHVAGTLSQSSSALFAPVSVNAAITTIRPASSLFRDAVLAGDAEGNVALFDAPTDSGPLTKHHLSSAYRGKAWHQLRRWIGTEPDDGAAGVVVSPATPTTAEVVIWSNAALKANMTNALAQSPPRARIATTPNAGGMQASVPVDVWDTEGNPSRIALQYRLNPWSSWQNAVVTQIDSDAPGLLFSASLDGTRHTLTWNALQNVGASFRGTVLLRTRAADDADTGAWSDQAAYFISTLTPYETWLADIANLSGPSASETADVDEDGIVNLLEYAVGTNPNTSNAMTGAVATSPTGIDFFYTRNKAATDLTYSVEWSDTLLNDWTTSGVSAPVMDSETATTQQIKVTIPTDIDVKRRFVRLKVTRL